MNEQINLSSSRAKQARLSRKIGGTGYKILFIISVICALAALLVWVAVDKKLALSLLGLAILCKMPATWWKQQLSVLPAIDNTLDGRLSLDVLARLKPGQAMDSQAVWNSINDHWQAGFFANHLLLDRNTIASTLSTDTSEFNKALQVSAQLADQNESQTIELGFLVAGIFLTSPGFGSLLTQRKSKPEDILSMSSWLGRDLKQQHLAKNSFGGIGRDWAFGYTPLLSHFGRNISMGIAKYGAHFGWLTQSDGVLAVEAAFNNHSNAVVLLGQDGIGKTSTVYAMAEKLIAGTTVPSLAYHQIVALNATDITSNARGPGELEHIMLSLVNEAAHAENIILFFDDAHMFFAEGAGSFDASQILLSIVESKAVPMIFAMSPSDFQRLRNTSQSLANLLTSVVIQEQPEASIMHILEDATVRIENQSHVLVAYEALKESYKLSGRFDQDLAYPGKAIKLLEQSVAHANNSVVTATSVQQAVEQSYGVKVGDVAPQEANELLHLEDDIHKRMINQSYAVKAVASALRRARAGVTDTNRPIGSFMFMGPTGVGKTELAKAIAATYFGNESAMVRLDMSEYQQPEDVQRLLATGQQETDSLLMSIRRQPSTVVLLDEIEKAHPNLLNLLLQMLDEGQLTDSAGKPASFKEAIIIATSNAGAQTIRERIEKGESLDSFANQFTDELINSGQFKPELINRFDEVILFRPLSPEELGQVVTLMMNDVNKTLSNQNINVQLTPAAVTKIVQEGNDPRLGARPMRRALQKAVEDTIAQKILSSEVKPGDQVTLDAPDLQF